MLQQGVDFHLRCRRMESSIHGANGEMDVLVRKFCCNLLTQINTLGQGATPTAKRGNRPSRQQLAKCNYRPTLVTGLDCHVISMV